jgi:monovalent cation:H+ antiporter-2, CPA2 family
MDIWTVLLDVLILLLTAIVLGSLFERLKQSAILGYLIAGTLLGPNAFNLMENHEEVAAIAELGVALLLFTIGLEFSWNRLRSIGRMALGGGTLQVLLTGGLSTWICTFLGLEWRPALAVGAMIALSSTACVLRLLVNRAEIDSVYGRNTLGILLLQDVAVVPLVIVVSVLGGRGSAAQIGWEIGRAVGMAALLVGALYLLLNFLVPRLLRTKEASRNRELPILLAIVTAIGSAWVSHKLGLSPVLGAFVAGILLAESPFATQIRADVAPLRTLFVTLFFSSIGMLSNPAWALEHWPTVAAVVAAIVFGKTLVASLVARLFRSSPGNAVALGICLAQVGEFSFVLAGISQHGKLIDSNLFELIITATIVTLFLTPYLISLAPHLSKAVGRLTASAPRELHPLKETSFDSDTKPNGHIVIVGFGPAGRGAAEELIRDQEAPVVVVELNPGSAAKAQANGLRTYIGDATRTEVLEKLNLDAARTVVVTPPDPTTVRQIVKQVHLLSPDTPIIARARYNMYRYGITLAGAHAVVDEEKEVGLRIAFEVLKVL